MRAALLAALLIVFPGAAPAAQALLAKLAARDFVALEVALAEQRAGYRPDAKTERALWDTFRAFGRVDVRTEDIEAWLKAAPVSYDARLAAGMHYRGLGWIARGSGYASQTSPTRFADGHAHFATALRHARHSLALEARPMLSHALILDIARHLPGAEEREEDAYAAALEMEPTSYLAYAHRMGALHPKWGGSAEAMQQLVRDARAAGMQPESLARLDALRLWFLAELEESRDDRAALALVDRSIAVHEIASALVLRGRVQRKLGDAAGAQASFERALRLDADEPYALNNLARSHWLRGQRALALETFQRAARAGNDWSANHVGRLLHSGAAGKRDPRAAFDWFALGARLGNAGAMYNLGECYLAGDCRIRIDHAQALHWFRRADAYGNQASTMAIAAMHWEGQGVPQDDAAAVRLWLRGVRSDEAEVRRVARHNLMHLLDVRRGVPALVRSSSHPALAAALFGAMGLLPLIALVLAVRDGALRLTRRAAAGSRVISAHGLLWLTAWAWPPLAGMGLWVAYVLGYVPEFLIVLVLFVLLCVPSVLILYVIGSGEWRVDVDAARLRYGRGGLTHEIAWAQIATATRESGVIRIVTRTGQVHELDSWPFGNALWREIAARRKP
jgi:TPR repeat protein